MPGSIVVYVLLVIAFLLAVPAISHTGLETWMSLTASVVAFVAMALNQFLATRPRYFEGAFGGLDRMYATHRNLGKIAFALILVHYFIEPNFKGQILTSGLNDLAEQAGEIGFYALMVLIGVSLFKKTPFTKFEVPYHLWYQSHRLIGVAFIFIAFHQMFIKRPFDGNALLAGYLNIFAVIGILSFIYIQIAPFLRRRAYTVTSVDQQGGATLISAAPDSRPLKRSAGQFAVINFDKPGLKEPHPFTISGVGPEGELNFAIKALGDFTKRLQDQIAVGDKMAVQGGYGRFNFKPKYPRQLWLAGGIGITPFLAMAQDLPADLQQDVCLLHCVRDVSEAINGEMLKAKAAETAKFSYVVFASDADGRLDAEKLKDRVPFELDGAAMMFCGPPPLRLAVVDGLKKMGKKFSAVKFELFEFR